MRSGSENLSLGVGWGVVGVSVLQIFFVGEFLTKAPDIIIGLSAPQERKNNPLHTWTDKSGARGKRHGQLPYNYFLSQSAIRQEHEHLGTIIIKKTRTQEASIVI